MKNIIFHVGLLSILAYTSVFPIVYNFRMAQITRQPIAKQAATSNKTPYTFSTLFYTQFQKKYVGDTYENFTGDLNSFVYNFKSSYYVRADLAFAQINQKKCGVSTFSQAEMDDLLFTIGRNFNPNKRSRVTVSGLFGIPTHSSYILQRLTMSAGQVGTGIQLDGLYKLQEAVDFLWGTRYLYFFPTHAQATTGKCYKFTIGNATDLLIALKSNWKTSPHGIEGGYSAHWNFGARICPTLATVTERTNFMRNSVYFVYKYAFKSEQYNQQLLFSMSYGRDSKPEKYGYQRVIMAWASWGINF